MLIVVNSFYNKFIVMSQSSRINETRMTRAGWEIKYSRRDYEQLLTQLVRSKYYFRLSIYWILIVDIWWRSLIAYSVSPVTKACISKNI